MTGMLYDAIARRYARFILARPKTVLAAFLVLCAASIHPALQIQSDFNLEGFYSETDPVVQRYRLFEQEFGRDDRSIVIGIETRDLLNRDAIQALLELHEAIERLPHVAEVRSLAKAERMVNRNDDLEFERHLSASTMHSEVDRDSLLASLRQDPYIRDVLIDTQGRSTMLTVDLDPESNSYANRNVLISELERVLAEADTFPGLISTHISGVPFFRNIYVNMLNRELFLYISVSSVLIILLLWYLYRSVWGVVLPILIVWLTLLLTLALIQISGGYLEIMSSTIAPILLCVGIADSIHMISKFDDARDQGYSREESITEMIRTLGSATLLTSVTTAIGFATLATSPIMPMKRFGLYTAGGVMLAYVVTMVFLPAALSLAGRDRIFNQSGNLFSTGSARALEAINRFNVRHRRSILVAGVAILALFLGLSTRLHVNARVFDDVSEDTRVMRDRAWFDEELVSFLPIEVIVASPEEEGVLRADFVRSLQETESFLLGIPEIRKVTGFHTLIGEVHSALSVEAGAHDAHAGSPKTDAMVAQYSLLLDVSEPDLLADVTNFTFDQARITALVQDAGSRRINEILLRIEEHMVSTYPDWLASITGTTVLSADHVSKIVESLLNSIGLAVVIISVIMALLFKDVRFVLISLIPNILPLVVTAGLMGWLGVDIKPSTAVIFTIAFGIAVDDTIHVISRFRIELDRVGDPHAAMSHAIIKTGKAVVITSLILLTGFGSLISSDFVSTAMMGLLVSVTILTALFADLLLLPALFHLLYRSRSPRST